MLSPLLMELIIGGIEKKTGRKFTRFSSYDEVKRFLEEGELVGQTLPNKHIVNRLTCVEKAGLNLDLVRGITKRYAQWFIQLKR
jgi:hypothetical protein